MAKILIVDDEPRIRELIRENLQYSGYTCEEAGDGSAALSLLTGGGYDLVMSLDFYTKAVFKRGRLIQPKWSDLSE